MNWVFSVAAIMVAVAVFLRLLWWAFGRSHQLASQQHTSTENATDLHKTENGAEKTNDK